MDDLGRPADGGADMVVIGPLVLKMVTPKGVGSGGQLSNDGNVVAAVAVIIESDHIAEVHCGVIPDDG